MANALGELFQDIADAIRSKTGGTDTLKPNQFPSAIEGITTGGGEGEKPFDCHSVTFVYGDKSYVRSVADGDTCADPVERGLIPTPTKESTAQYNYTFYGWGASDGGAADDNILKNITEDKTVYAIFTATVRYYTITWLDSDGVTELPGQKQWAYGTVPSYTPTKDGYVFVRWNPATSTVVSNTTYTAVWEEATVRCELSGTTLRIFGYGEMPYSTYEKPWEESASLITEVIVDDGVTTIGNGVFRNHTAIKSVSIADSVTSIGMNAFYGCTSLTAVSIPENVARLEVGSFQGCSKLAEVSLPDSLTFIGNQSFAGTALVSLTIPDEIPSLGQIVPNVTTLTSVIIGAKVKSITANAFYGCTNLANVTFKDTSGWYVTQTSGASNGTSISSSNLADTAKAATYLKTTYRAYYWYDKT